MVEESKELDIGNDIIEELKRVCRPEVYNALRLNDEDKKNIIEYVTRIKGGNITWLSIICAGNTCIYRKTCPLLAVNKPPLSKRCPFEEIAIRMWEKDYVESLNVDMNDKVDRTQVHELVESDIMISRANVILGVDGFIMDNPVGVDHETGTPVYRKEEHIAINVRERAQKRRDRIMKSFLATRESKVRVMTRTVDPTAYQAKLRERMKELIDKKRAINITMETTIDETVEKSSI